MAQNTASGRQNPGNRRRNRRRNFHYMLLLLFCIGIGLTLCFTVLFKVSTVKVKNSTYYSAEEIVTRSGIQKGENLFQINTKDIQRMLEDKLPYLSEVRVKRRLPTTILIEVKEEIPMGAAYTENGYAVVSYTGKILKNKIMAPPAEIPVILGLEEYSFTPGSYLYDMKEDERGRKKRILSEKVSMLQHFYDTAQEYDLMNITYIDITLAGQIKALYDGRILIDFGGELDLDKKMNFVQTVLEQGIAENHPLSGYTDENFQGTIDITNRKQLRTRALAVNTVWDERAFTVFQDENNPFPEEGENEEKLEETEEPQETPEPDAGTESSDENIQESEDAGPETEAAQPESTEAEPAVS